MQNVDAEKETSATGGRGVAANSQLKKGGGAEGASLFTNWELPRFAPILVKCLIYGFGEKGAPSPFVPVSFAPT
jgi:hypothetical protein